MQDPGALAYRLAEASDAATAAERLAEHLRTIAPACGARVYLLGPGDRCGTCPKARTCTQRSQCLHLVAGLGDFAQPPGQALRIPRHEAPWAGALGAPGAGVTAPTPTELEAPGDGGSRALMMGLEAGGEVLGAVGVRLPAGTPAPVEESLRTAGYLAAAAIRTLKSRREEQHRLEQLLLVNELGRKVNSILNADLLLKQAASDVQRTFGFHNVMVLMLDESRQQLELKAHASRYAAPLRQPPSIPASRGITGRAVLSGRTEVVEDVRSDPDFVGWFADTRSEIAVPIQVAGQVAGVLNVESDSLGAFGPSDRLVLETVANQLAISWENARLFGMVKTREDRYRALVESNPAAVLHLDGGGHITYANPAVHEVTGYEAGPLREQVGTLVRMAVEADRERVGAAVAQAVGGQPVRDVEFQVTRADGSLRTLTASLQPALGEQGELQGAVVLARDRTQERELQEKLTQSEKLGAIGGLVSGVAHELNNPLAGILGMSQLLLSRPAETWGRGDLEKIEQNATRCQRIVENLLTFARQSRMSKRRANLNEIIESVAALNDYQFHMDNVRIERDLDPQVPAFPLDVTRWQQVIVNLATNAHQAMVQSHSPERVVRFQTRLKGREVVLRVSDTGPGIPEHLRSRIFEPFFTTKEKGTGLGLGICFGIVRDHGGTIEAEADHEAGAHFRITLPVTEGAAPALQAAPVPVTDLAEAGEGRRVLVVDDDTAVSDVVVRALMHHRYRVDVADTGARALELARADVYDVIISDVSMPGELDGIGLHERLRATLPRVAERVVFMTGDLLNERSMRWLESNTARSLSKPFDIRTLAAVVDEVARLHGPPPGPREPR
ncbi:MAG: ATP-binding protein [Planctomycetia bacterium]